MYNRTSQIANVAYNITLSVPGARVAVGHGQMDKNELEDVMMRFVNKEFNVLVCTTIIEQESIFLMQIRLLLKTLINLD